MVLRRKRKKPETVDAAARLDEVTPQAPRPQGPEGSQSERASSSAERRGPTLPGGSSRLSSLGQPSSGQPSSDRPTYSNRAFRDPDEVTPDSGATATQAEPSFESYFPTDSLFEEPSRAPLSKALDQATYRVLGLDASATWDEVVAAHRELAKKYHPDRMIGATPAEVMDATERLMEISDAYAQLEKARRGR